MKRYRPAPPTNALTIAPKVRPRSRPGPLHPTLEVSEEKARDLLSRALGSYPELCPVPIASRVLTAALGPGWSERRLQALRHSRFVKGRHYYKAGNRITISIVEVVRSHLAQEFEG